MKNKPHKATSADNLRLQAEEMLKNKPFPFHSTLSNEETVKQFHELEIHQIELELQNEALLEAQSEALEALDLYEFAPTGYFTLSREGKIIRINQNGASLLHIDKASLGEKMFYSFITEETKPVFKDFFQNIYQSKEKVSCEVSLRTPDNTTLYVYLTGNPDKKGELCLVTAINITEPKQSEENLKQERELYQDIVNNQPAGIYRIRVFRPEKWWKNAWTSSENPPYQIELANDQFCALLKITRQEFEANPAIIIDLIHPEDKPEFILRNERANTEIIPFRWEGRLVVKGEIIWLHIESIPRPIINEEVLWTGILYDITDQKLGEAALKESENKYRELVDNSPDAIAIHQEGKVVFVNKECLRLMVASTEADLLGKQVIDFVHTDYRPVVIERTRKVLTGGKILPLEEEKFIRLNGSTIDVEVKSMPILFQNNPAVQVIVRDITDRKMAEKLLIESEDRFHLLFNKAPLGYQSLDIYGNFLEVNQQWSEILGYTREEVLGKWFGDFLLPEYQDGFRKRFPIFKSQGFIHSEFEMAHKNGTKLFIAFDGRIGNDQNGDFKQTHCILQDITERRIAENQLKKSQEDFKDLFNNAPVGYHEINSEGRILRINQTELSMLGYTAEELTGQYIWKYNANQNYSLEATKDKLQGRHILSTPYERELVKKDGSKITVLQHDRVLRTKDGVITGIRSSVQDITERKKAEIDLQFSEEKFRNIFENSIIGKSMTSIDGKVNVNKAFSQIIGYTKEELSNLNWTEFTHKEDIEFNRKEIKSILDGEKDFSQWEKRYIHKNGNIIWVNISTFLLRDKEGIPLYFITEIYDITERKKAEESLRESEELYRNLVLRIPDGLYKSTPKGKFMDVNPAMVKMLGYANKEELMTIDIESQLYFNSSDREYTLSNGQNEAITIFPLRKKDGSEIWVEDHGWYNLNAQGKVTIHEGVLRDITDRKRALDTLEESKFMLNKLLIANTEFIDTNSAEIDYAKMTETICQISGATYALFYLRNETNEYVIKSVSGWNKMQSKLKTIIGPDLINRSWGLDAKREEKIRENTISKFNSMQEFTQGLLPESISKVIEKTFNLGETFVVKISKNNKIIGDFTLHFTKGKTLQNAEIVELFANQAGLFLERDKTDKTLRANEEKYHYLFANNPQPMYIYDQETLVFLEVNQAAIDHYGYSKEEFMEMTLRDIRPPEDIPALLIDVENKNEKFKPAGIWRHIKKNGEIIFVDISTVSVILNGMNARHVLVQDITERQKAEEALRESEDKYRTMIENSNDMIWTVDKEGKFTFLNKIALETTELILEEWKGKSFIPLIMDEDMPMLTDIFKRSMLGEVCTYELRFKKTDGNILTILVNTSPIRISGEIEGIVSFGRDITESKKSLGLLRESEEKFRSIAEQTGDLISIANLHGVLEYASTASRSIFLYEPEEMCGHNFTDFLEEGSIEKAKTIFGRKFENGDNVSNLELKMKRKDNSIFYGEINGSRFKYGDNFGTLVVIRDMTERKKAQEELEEKMTELMRFQNLTVGREMTMIDLKKEVNELLKITGQKEKYKIVH